MSGLNNFAIQQAIKAYAITNFPQEVVSGEIPDGENLHLDNGVVKEYVVLRFSDIMPTSRSGSFMGARHNGYYSYFDALCVGPTDDKARELAAMSNDIFLGQKFPNAGEVGTNFGGGVFAVSSGERLPSAFVAVTSFRYELNTDDVGSGYLSA